MGLKAGSSAAEAGLRCRCKTAVQTEGCLGSALRRPPCLSPQQDIAVLWYTRCHATIRNMLRGILNDHSHRSLVEQHTRRRHCSTLTKALPGLARQSC